MYFSMLSESVTVMECRFIQRLHRFLSLTAPLQASTGIRKSERSGNKNRKKAQRFRATGIGGRNKGLQLTETKLVCK